MQYWYVLAKFPHFNMLLFQYLVSKYCQGSIVRILRKVLESEEGLSLKASRAKEAASRANESASNTTDVGSKNEQK